MESPLLCFVGVFAEARTLEILNAAKRPQQRPMEISQTHIHECKISHHTCYECIVFVPGGRRGLLTEIAMLAERFKGPILLFDKDVTAQHITQSNVDNLTNLYVINAIGMIGPLLNIEIRPEQAEALRKLLLEDYKPMRLPTPRAPGMDEQAYADRFVEAMQQGRHIEGPPEGLFGINMILHNPTVLMTPHQMTVIEDGDAEDPDFIAAQEASFHHHQQEREPPARRPRRLNPAWEQVLKEPEVAQQGDPVCVICHTNRASILFVNCSHQCMCDLCVRQMFELHGVTRACPMCREPCDVLNRPFLTEKAK